MMQNTVTNWHCSSSYTCTRRVSKLSEENQFIVKKSVVEVTAKWQSIILHMYINNLLWLYLEKDALIRRAIRSAIEVHFDGFTMRSTLIN